MYLIEKYTKFDDEIVYTIFDENTESSITLEEKRLIELIQNGICIKNIDYRNNNLEIKKWFNSVERTADTAGAYVLISIAKEHDVYTVVDEYGNVRYIHEDEILKNSLGERDKLNFRVIEGRLEYIDVTEINTRKGFKVTIENMYELYESKSKLLGLGSEFSYAIDNTDIILVEYTGSSKRVVLPNFITSINKEAFQGKEIESLKLNHGLKYIGDNAFKGCGLEHIIIPESVEYTWSTAFIGNNGFIKDKVVNRDRVKFKSNKTVVI